MPVHVRNTGWHQFPTIPQSGRLLYFRINGQWRPILDVWVRDVGAWHKEPEYSAILNAPTNLRMNPADPNNHGSIPVAWDWSGVLVPDDFELVLTNEGGGWLQDLSISAASRSYTFTGIPANARYRVYVRARHSGRTETAWSGPLNWYLGYDSYDAHDAPVYGWSGTVDWYVPYSGYNWASSEQLGWPATASIDGSDSTRWVTANTPEPYGGNQGEGIRIVLPTDKRLFTGVHIYSNGYTYCWLGLNWYGGWQGGAYPYSGKYTPLQHNYLGAGGGDPSSGSAGYYYYVQNGAQFGGAWDLSSGGANPYIDVLFQHNTPAQPQIEIWEIKVLLQSWVVVANNGSRIVPAANSGYY